MTMRRLCKCGKEIPQERLGILPDTWTCVNCSTETKYLGNVFGTTRHKGFEVEVIRDVAPDTYHPPRVLSNKRPKESDGKDTLRKESPQSKPKKRDVPRLPRQEDDHRVIVECNEEAQASAQQDTSRCFICKKEHKHLESYKPFPGVYCPRDKRRARAGKFVLRRLWSEAETLLHS